MNRLQKDGKIRGGSGAKEPGKRKADQQFAGDAPLEGCNLSRMSAITAFFSLTVDVRYSWSRSSRKRRSSTINSSIAANKGKKRKGILLDPQICKCQNTNVQMNSKHFALSLMVKYTNSIRHEKQVS